MDPDIYPISLFLLPLSLISGSFPIIPTLSKVVFYELFLLSWAYIILAWSKALISILILKIIFKLHSEMFIQARYIVHLSFQWGALSLKLWGNPLVVQLQVEFISVKLNPSEYFCCITSALS